MVKLIEVIGRRPDLTHAYFLKHLSTTHLEMVDRVPEFRDRVRRYTQNFLLVDPSELATIQGLTVSTNADALIEVWYDRFSDMVAAFQEPRYFEILRPDELAFGDVPGAWGVVTDEASVMERSGFAGLTKLFVFVKRTDGISHATFRMRWGEARSQRLMLANAFRTCIGRYVENWVSQDPAETLPNAKPYDLIAELWLDFVKDVAEFAADRDVAAALGPGAGDYIDITQTRIYVAQESPASAEWLRKGNHHAHHP
jgi:EthD domain